MDHDELAVALSYAVGFGSSGAATSAPSSSAKPAGKPAAKAKGDDEDMDLFGDDDDVNSDGENAEEAAATVARRQRMEAARKLKADADAKKGAVVKKEKPAEKSLIVLEVKGKG